MWDRFALGGAPLINDVCMCWVWVCVRFLWVCGILAHNSCSSQVTAPFSRTYLAFLPRHDYHTPSTLGLATWNISIIPEWNWSNVPEMKNLNQQPPLSLLPYLLFFIPHPFSLPPHCLLLIHPLRFRFLLLFNRNPLVQPFNSPPESAVCVCWSDWVIWQWHLFCDLLLGLGRKGRDGARAGIKRQEKKLFTTVRSIYAILF